MNSLGRGRDACVVALQAYLSDICRLITSSQKADRAVDVVMARSQVERLTFHLEVDVDARSSAVGTERMTEVEGAQLLPALARLQADVAAIPTSESLDAWAPALIAARGALTAAIARIRSWEHAEA